MRFPLGRWLVVGICTVLFGPIVIAGGFIMGSSLLAGLFNISWNPFDLSDISLLDWLAAGPGATGGEFRIYITGFAGAVIAAFAATPIFMAYKWAKGELNEM